MVLCVDVGICVRSQVQSVVPHRRCPAIVVVELKRLLTGITADDHLAPLITAFGHANHATFKLTEMLLLYPNPEPAIGRMVSSVSTIATRAPALLEYVIDLKLRAAEAPASFTPLPVAGGSAFGQRQWLQWGFRRKHAPTIVSFQSRFLEGKCIDQCRNANTSLNSNWNSI